MIALLPVGQVLGLWNDFFAAGSLVFGGGHVVLPLLQELVGGQMSPDQFLTGYAAAQAVPGPMFSLASYLGAVLLPSSPWLGALIATLAIFLPGFLLVLGLMEGWQWLSSRPALAGAVAGINAAVVGPIAGRALSAGLYVGGAWRSGTCWSCSRVLCCCAAARCRCGQWCWGWRGWGSLPGCSRHAQGVDGGRL